MTDTPPRTARELPAQYHPADVEQRRYEQWASAEIARCRADAQSAVLPA